MKYLAIMIVLAFAFVMPVHSQITETPEIVLKDLNGQTVRLSDFKGKIVLLNFWATWCVPCAAEVPELVKWQSKFKEAGLQVVGVTFPPTNTAAVRRFVRAKKINYPILFGAKRTKSLFDPSETLPITVIIDKAGKVVGKIDGIIFQDEFDEKVQPLLK